MQSTHMAICAQKPERVGTGRTDVQALEQQYPLSDLPVKMENLNEPNTAAHILALVCQNGGLHCQILQMCKSQTSCSQATPIELKTGAHGRHEEHTQTFSPGS